MDNIFPGVWIFSLIGRLIYYWPTQKTACFITSGKPHKLSSDVPPSLICLFISYFRKATKNVFLIFAIATSLSLILIVLFIETRWLLAIFLFLSPLFAQIFLTGFFFSLVSYRRGTVIVKDSNKSDWLYIIVSVSKQSSFAILKRSPKSLCFVVDVTLWSVSAGFLSLLCFLWYSFHQADLLRVCSQCVEAYSLRPAFSVQ